MRLIEFAWTFVLIIWRLAKCGFPIIDDAVIIKNGTNHIITNTNLNIKIRCGRDAKTINDTINMINNVKCASREFNVIFQGDVNLDMSYRIDSGSIGRTNMAVNGYRVVIYNGSGDIIQTYKSKLSFENNNRGRLPKNTTLLRCVSPIFEGDQYYLYRCWPFVLNEPLSFIGVAFRSVQDLKFNKIHWQIRNGKPSRYIIKAINLNTKKCIINEYLVKGTVSYSSTQCTLAKIHWYSFNMIELIDLDPITTYEILVVPLDRQYSSSSITIRTSYGSSGDRCFADCIFKSNDGFTKYTGIRQVNEKGNSCDEACSTKHVSDRVMCPINKIYYNCNIPFCSYLRLPMASCPSLISNRFSTHINLYLSDYMKQELVGFIVLLYEDLKCQQAIVLTNGQHELSLSVKSFFLPCPKRFNYHQIEYYIKLGGLSLKNDYTTFVIPIITTNETGFVLKTVHNKNAAVEHIKHLKKRSVNQNDTNIRFRTPYGNDRTLNAFYISLMILLIVGLLAVITAILIFLFRLFIRLREWKKTLGDLQTKSANFLSRTQQSSKEKSRTMSKEQETLITLTEISVSTETQEGYLRSDHMETIMGNPALDISTESSS